VEGVKGKALSFDGKQDWIKVEHSPDLDLNQDLTLTAWVKDFDPKAYGEIVWYGDSQPARDPYQLFMSNSAPRIKVADAAKEWAAEARKLIDPKTWSLSAGQCETFHRGKDDSDFMPMGNSSPRKRQINRSSILICPACGSTSEPSTRDGASTRALWTKSAFTIARFWSRKSWLCMIRRALSNLPDGRSQPAGAVGTCY